MVWLTGYTLCRLICDSSLGYILQIIALLLTIHQLTELKSTTLALAVFIIMSDHKNVWSYAFFSCYLQSKRHVQGTQLYDDTANVVYIRRYPCKSAYYTATQQRVQYCLCEPRHQMLFSTKHENASMDNDLFVYSCSYITLQIQVASKLGLK